MCPKDSCSPSELPWTPSAKLDTLRLRAEVLARIRAFFAQRGVWEVETPTLSPGATTDPALHSFQTLYTGPGAPDGRALYLQTSPEFAMKRLLAAGSGSIYQLGKMFRDGEQGRLHNPEFTLLEWYRIGFDQHALMDEVEALIRGVLVGDGSLAPAVRTSYGAAFEGVLGLDPHRADVATLRHCAAEAGLSGVDALGGDRDAWLELLFSHRVQPRLPDVCFIHDYPASQAALARLRPGDPPVAERFELFIHGLELANGFHELTDPAEQRRRFEAERRVRQSRGLNTVPLDEHLLAAMAHGLPACAGVALGIDRLVMIAAGKTSLAEVMAFPIERA